MAPSDEEDFSDELGDPYGDYLASLGSRYTVTAATESRLDELAEILERFEMLKRYNRIAIGCAAELSDGHASCAFCVLLCDMTVKGMTDYGAPDMRTERKVYPVVLLSLSRDWGRVLIRPETLQDKIAGIITHVEVDFPEHPQFSRFHYVLASDEARLRGHMTRALMDIIGGYRGLVIEIGGDRMLAGSEREFTAEDAGDLIDFALRFAVEER